jgi:hypothetical protein
MKKNNEKKTKKVAAPRAVVVSKQVKPNSRLGRVIAQYKASGGGVRKKVSTCSKRKAPMTIGVVCYRKAYPQEILFQVEPVLRHVGMKWWEILGLLKPYLRERGFEMHVWNPGDPSAQLDEFTFVSITNDRTALRRIAQGDAALNISQGNLL